MTFAGEVLHVLKKDLRQARLMAVGYIVLALLAAVSAASGVGSDLADSASGVVPMVLVLWGAVLVGAAVQEDSPVRATAFWTTRPLRAPAVAIGKLLLALLLVLGAVVAQALALAWLRVSLAEGMALTLLPALRLGGVLLAAAIVAAATRTLGQFVAGSMVLSAAWLTLANRDEARVLLPEWLRLAVPLVLLALVLALQYRRRSVLAFTGIGVAVVLLGAFVRSPQFRESLPVPGPAPLLAPAPDASGRAVLRQIGSVRKPGLPATWQLQLPRDWRRGDLLLASATLVALDARGAADTIATSRPRRLLGAFVSGDEALTWVLGPEAVARLRRAGDVVFTAELAELHPARFGAVAARRGQRAGGRYPMAVLAAAVVDGRVRLMVSTAGVNRLGASVRRVSYAHELMSHEFSLVDSMTGVRLRLRPVGGSSVGRTVVLPGTNLLREKLVLESDSSGAVTVERLQRSRIEVTGWTPARRFRAELPVSVE